MKLTGIVLAGGKSSRFGFNKIKVKLGKIPLFIDQIFKLSFFCNEILISSSIENYKTMAGGLKNIENYYNYYCFSEDMHIPPVKIVLDDIKLDNRNNSNLSKIGPIAGIYTGLTNAKNLFCLVLAFDMPFISYNLLELLVEKNQNNSKDVVVIKTKKGFEALCGLYSKKCIKIMERNIKKGIYKISDIYPCLNTEMILEADLKQYNIDMLNFFNINTLADNNDFKKIWRSGIAGNDANYFSSKVGKKWENFFYRGAGKEVKVKKL